MQKKRICDNSKIDLVNSKAEDKLNVNVCVGTSCYLKGASGILSKLLQKAESGKWTEGVDINATFCFEKCDKGPTVSIGDKVYTKADVDTLIKEIDSRLEEKKK